jgi:hypothetical protein
LAAPEVLDEGRINRVEQKNDQIGELNLIINLVWDTILKLKLDFQWFSTITITI